MALIGISITPNEILLHRIMKMNEVFASQDKVGNLVSGKAVVIRGSNQSIVVIELNAMFGWIDFLMYKVLQARFLIYFLYKLRLRKDGYKEPMKLLSNKKLMLFMWREITSG